MNLAFASFLAIGIAIAPIAKTDSADAISAEIRFALSCQADFAHMMRAAHLTKALPDALDIFSAEAKDAFRIMADQFRDGALASEAVINTVLLPQALAAGMTEADVMTLKEEFLNAPYRTNAARIWTDDLKNQDAANIFVVTTLTQISRCTDFINSKIEQ